MADKDQSPGISTIERMAAENYAKSYRGGPPIVDWYDLTPEDRQRHIDAMEAAVGVIPDVILLKAGAAADTVETGPARDAILGDHEQSKKSVLYGR